MKAMIEREVLADILKMILISGRGGFAKLSYFQVFQLIYGGSKRELQDRQCLVI